MRPSAPAIQSGRSPVPAPGSCPDRAPPPSRSPACRSRYRRRRWPPAPRSAVPPTPAAPRCSSPAASPAPESASSPCRSPDLPAERTSRREAPSSAVRPAPAGSRPPCRRERPRRNQGVVRRCRGAMRGNPAPSSGPRPSCRSPCGRRRGSGWIPPPRRVLGCRSCPARLRSSSPIGSAHRQAMPRRANSGPACSGPGCGLALAVPHADDQRRKRRRAGGRQIQQCGNRLSRFGLVHQFLYHDAIPLDAVAHLAGRIHGVRRPPQDAPQFLLE